MLESGIDGTRKYLFGLEDGNVIESVLMRYHHGNSVCISSQVGCRMGCRFCASTLDGLARNLTAVGDAGTDLPDPGIHRREGFQRGGHGNRGAPG